MRLRWNSMSRWALVALLLVAPGVPELLAQEGEGAPDRLVRGRRSFQVHCVNCHGDEGRGDGPLAEILRVPPRDLTQLSRNNDGEFPTDRIYQAIDGRSEIVGHGRREMPVWGLTFLERGRDTAEEKATQERIIDLIFYLRMIQASPPEKAPREPR